MKRLRILTGLHAGVTIALDAGDVSIGAGDEADVRIDDWTMPELRLSIDQDGGVQSAAGAIPDFDPQVHGAVVICLGPTAAPWPSDVELLQRLYAAGPDGSAERARWRTPALLGAGALACGLAMLCALLLMSEPGHALTQSESADPAVRMRDGLQTRIAQLGLSEVRVSERGGALQLQGYVPDLAADGQVRDAALALGATVDRRYRIVSSDEQALRQIIGRGEVRVDYAGNGTFTLAGTVPSLADFDRTLARAKTELGGPAALRFDSSVTETPAKLPTAAYSNLFSSEDLRYARTPDGITHLFPAPAAASAAEAGSAADPRIRILSAESEPPPAEAERETGNASAGRSAPAIPVQARASRARSGPPSDALLRGPLPADGEFIGLPAMDSRP